MENDSKLGRILLTCMGKAQQSACDPNGASRWIWLDESEKQVGYQDGHIVTGNVSGPKKQNLNHC